MKKIIAWLETNKIEYSVNKYGNPQYFNDGFSVDGIKVTFYSDGIGNAPEKKRLLLDYMRRKKLYVCQESYFGAGYTYRIMAIADADRLEHHEKSITDAVEKFWKEEHNRRIQADKTA
mgnify:FL=1